MPAHGARRIDWNISLLDDHASPCFPGDRTGRSCDAANLNKQPPRYGCGVTLTLVCFSSRRTRGHVWMRVFTIAFCPASVMFY